MEKLEINHESRTVLGSFGFSEARIASMSNGFSGLMVRHGEDDNYSISQLIQDMLYMYANNTTEAIGLSFHIGRVFGAVSKLGKMSVNLEDTLIRKVRRVLYAVPEARDNDMLLAARIWAEEEDRISKMSGYAFLSGMAQGRYSHFESISRIRRKLQEDNVVLRGNKWVARHTQMQEKIKEQLKLNFNG